MTPLKTNHPGYSLEHSQGTSGCAEDKFTPLNFEYVVASPAKLSTVSHSTSLQPWGLHLVCACCLQQVSSSSRC